MDVLKGIKPTINELKEKHANIKFIILYGSFALGRQKKWSDVDIGIFYTGKHIQHSSRILDLDRTRLVSLICRDLKQVKETLKDPYSWINFVKRIEQSKLIWQKDHAFDKFKKYVKLKKPEPKDFGKYTQKFLADILEYLGKARNAEGINRDKYGKIVATSCFWLLTPINKIKPYDQKDELHFFTQLKNKPEKFDKLFEKILMGKGTLKEIEKLARETVKYAEQKGIFKQDSWYTPFFKTGKIYDLL